MRHAPQSTTCSPAVARPADFLAARVPVFASHLRVALGPAIGAPPGTPISVEALVSRAAVYAPAMPAPGPTNDAQDLSADTFAAFYRQNHQPALNLVRCRAERADHEAVVADAFLVAWQHQQATGALSRAWFYGVLRNKIGDFYRSARRREVPTEFLDIHEAEDEDSSHSEDRLDVQRVLRSLPGAHSEPLILAYWCDLTAAEAAGALGITEGTLRVRLHRARRAFLKEYDRQADRSSTLEEVTPWTVQNG